MNQMPNPKRNPRWCLRALLACLLGAQLLCAQATARESDVEAAYLFNFGKFMRTTNHPGTAFKIGILGTNPFGSKLVQLTAQEMIDGRPMKVVEIAKPEDARTCDILFVDESDRARMERDLEQLGNASVLTVSTSPDFLKEGGMIQFVVQQNRVRFAVNLDAATRAHIQLSSELLKVAVSVSSGSAAGEERR